MTHHSFSPSLRLDLAAADEHLVSLSSHRLLTFHDYLLVQEWPLLSLSSNTFYLVSYLLSMYISSRLPLQYPSFFLVDLCSVSHNLLVSAISRICDYALTSCSGQTTLGLQLSRKVSTGLMCTSFLMLPFLILSHLVFFPAHPCLSWLEFVYFFILRGTVFNAVCHYLSD